MYSSNTQYSWFTFLESWVLFVPKFNILSLFMLCMTGLSLSILNIILNTLVYVVKMIMTLVSQLMEGVWTRLLTL